MAIKDVLPKLREQRGLTQQELAHKLFVTRQAVIMRTPGLSGNHQGASHAGQVHWRYWRL